MRTTPVPLVDELGNFLGDDDFEIPFDDHPFLPRPRDLIQIQIDALVRQQCIDNPGKPYFVFYDEDYQLTSTDNYQMAIDFSLRSPFYVVSYDPSYHVISFRICI